jgi:hypothetical protein
MRILALSDICWLPRNQGTDLKRLIGLVEQVAPTLVLLAGDLLDDFKIRLTVNHQERSMYWKELRRFLSYLEQNKTMCYIVKGNWDTIPEYDDLVKQKRAYIEEISERLVEFNQIHIQGIPHAFTDKLTTMRGIHRLCPNPVDIVLTHAEGRRRIWLFELSAKLIITGHFDQQFCLVRDKIFLSFSRFPGQYAVIDYLPHEIAATYIYRSFNPLLGLSRSRRYEARFVNGTADWITEPRAEWIQYAQQTEALLDFKEQLVNMSLVEKQEAVQNLLSQGVYKAHIEEYIPGSSSLLKKK